MGWETRPSGRRYLYRSVRAGGRVVKEYLGRDDPFSHLMAAEVAEVQARRADLRATARAYREGVRDRADEVAALVEAANIQIRTVVHGLLVAAGYHRHKRGEWRMKKLKRDIEALIQRVQENQAKPSPVVRYAAPAGDAEAAEVFQKVRDGDPAAADRVRALIRERDWVDWIGDVGRQATHQLIGRLAGGDPVFRAGLTEKAAALRDEVLGPDPTVLEQLLARRVVNGWLHTHALELELAVRPPRDAKAKDYLDRALTRAQKRLAEAVRELARVRRLQAPA